MPNSTKIAGNAEIPHNPGLSPQEAEAGYLRWLGEASWRQKPSFLYWWFMTENGPAEPNEALRDKFRTFMDEKRPQLRSVCVPRTVATSP